MKACPVCGALAFEDAVQCFGCLHRFGEEEPDAGGCEMGCEEPSGPTGVELPEFCIRFSPFEDEVGGLAWKCVVETSAGAVGQVVAMR